ncbi:hypothetical protein Dfri01_59590 [Dyadobacter frigoris]|uniref:hypothetical protein n=1 Tax=Dyadobacter frigoris TaxID=2576211 RepID=UPI00249FD6AD|nr:hypothetical protein [Dyadobacter frigoris]GLU56498.1 hypothetical protein Dfri01_59590 [Dyadobacter frigoris]
MDSVSKDEIKRIQGAYQQKYGEVLDPLTAMLLNEVQEIKTSGSKEKSLVEENILREITSMKDIYKPFTTTEVKVAFFYGLGKYAWTWIAAIALFLSIILYHIRETSKTEYQEAKQILSRYPNVVKLETLIKNAKVVEKDQGLFLQVEPATKTLLLGKTYVIDPERALKKDAPIILIPLSFK